MFRRILLNRGLWLVAAELVLVVVLTRLVVPPDVGFNWVIGSGYWFTLASVWLFLAALVPLVHGRWRQFRFERFDKLAVVLGFVCVGIWVSQEKPGFKILADEVQLLGTSMGMHYERAAAYPVRATDIQGPFQILDHALDKRPLLFPFLTATIHDVTGYRPENPFYLNMGLGVIFMGLAYVLGWIAGGHRWAGVLNILLFAGLPLMAQQASGGGFELLNLVLIETVGLSMLWYLEAPDTHRLEVVVFAGLLLASTRYESIIFLLPVVVAVIWGWCRCGRVLLSWPVAISPLFLIPLLLQNRIFAGQPAAWELASMPGATRPFGPEFLQDNLGHALAFFFNFDPNHFLRFDPYQPSSQIFALLGLLALPFFALWLTGIFRRPASSTPREIALALFGCGLFAVTLLYAFYFLGQFDNPIVRRLSLPVHLLLALAILVVGSTLLKTARGWKTVALIAFGGMLAHGLPVMAKRAYEASYSPGVEMELRRTFLASMSERDFLVIDNDSVFWITHKIVASPIGRIQQRKDSMIYLLRNHVFSRIYVFQSVLIDDQTGRRSIDPADDLGPDFELETIWEPKVQTLLRARISRVVAIRNEGVEAVRATEAVPVLGERRTKEELEKARVDYLENFFKKLP